MTDPIQQTNPQQQGSFAQQTGQQWQQYTDDILGGEDIFANIPEVEEDDLPYGDILEKKYQFEPIPEFEPEVPNTVQEKPAPVPEKQPVPVVEKQPVVAIPEPVAEEEIENIEHESALEQTKVEGLLDTKLQTDVQKKFGELYFTTKKIYELKEKLWIEDDTFDVIGADNDKVFISYRFFLDETDQPILFLTKIEQEKDTEEETVNELKFTFNEETSSLEVMVNDTLLFDEIQDFTEDPKKKMQVSEKLNKFIFLASEELRKIEKEIKAKEEAEQERRKLQDIFRNF